MLSATALSATARAGGDAPRFFVSTTSDVPGSGTRPPVEDGDVLAIGAGAAATLQLTAGHWLAAAGVVPDDVDALGRRPGTRPGSHGSLCFSLLSNQGGFLDGDVLGLASGGGLEVLIAEGALTQGFGVPAANVDVDAIAFDEAGRLLFSLQNDLDGTLLGLVENGDVLRLESDGNVSRLLSEADVQQKLFDATGLVSSIGDVHAVEWVAGEAWVALQSPSSVDGGVLSCGAAPVVVLDESVAGLEGAEIDALMRVGAEDELAVIRIEPREAAPGAPVHVDFSGADPWSVHLVLFAGGAGYVDFAGMPGFGAWYFDPVDPLLHVLLSMKSVPIAVMDGEGHLGIDAALPSGFAAPGLAGESGWSFQMMDVATLELSAPFRVRTP